VAGSPAPGGGGPAALRGPGGIPSSAAAAYSLGHGANDAQKTMGMIADLLFATGRLGPEFHVPLWIVLAAHGAVGLGTLAGGWRIVKTLGMDITRVEPVGGCGAETPGATMLIGTALAGSPVSTTHTITGAIVGVGATTRLSAVRWGIAGRIVWAWILTIPVADAVAGASWWMLARGW
jgi:PiT family inorganic phosphate transporter